MDLRASIRSHPVVGGSRRPQGSRNEADSKRVDRRPTSGPVNEESSPVPANSKQSAPEWVTLAKEGLVYRG